ncbi:MAG: DEAD/DEAH box helicase [Candidatus Heimdallarchaeota archaeon]
MEIHHLTRFGVSPEIIERIQRRGILSLRSVQSEAIKRGIQGTNLVVTSPPGSGKTLIGEILGLQRLIADMNKKCVFLFPLKALARQKYVELIHHYSDLGYQISYSTGDVELTHESFEMADILVSTYERFDSFLRSNPDHITYIGTLMCDEIHTVGSPNRGARLEALLTRILDAAKYSQIIGLSATIGNPDSIANWLNAELITSTERLPLHYKLLISDDKFSTISNILAKSMRTEKQALIFVNTRSEAETLAVRLAKTSHEYIPRSRMNAIVEYLSTDFLAQIEDPTTPTASKLLECVRKGIGWHHAGLTQAERVAVEEAFGKQYLLILTATPTLAAGLNLPTSSVIIRDLKLWNHRWISPNDIHQRAGRAGRPMLDTEGQVILLASDEDELKTATKKYFRKEGGTLQPKYEPITSYLSDLEALQEQILTQIVQYGTTSRHDIVNMFQKSLWWTQKREERINEHLEAFLFPATPQYALHIRGTPDRQKEIIKSRILQMGVDRVTGIVQTGHRVSQHYTVSFDLRRGAYCSCSQAASLLHQGTLCMHLTHLADRILRTKTNPFYPPITRLLKELSPIYYLISHGLINEFEGAQYRATLWGQLASRLYLKPKTIVLIRDAILSKPLTSQKNAIRAALQALQIENRTINLPLVDTVTSLTKWLLGLPFSQILDDSPVLYAGDMENLVEGTAWVLSCLSKITGTLGERFTSYSDELRVLAKRMNVGLPENAVILKEKLGITRGKAMALVNGGIRSFEELQAMPVNELNELKRIQGIGKNTLQLIQKALIM